LAPSAPNSCVSDGAALDDPEFAVDESVELLELELREFAPFELAEQDATG
jgi:hypothetical protein